MHAKQNTAAAGDGPARESMLDGDDSFNVRSRNTFAQDRTALSDPGAELGIDLSDEPSSVGDTAPGNGIQEGDGHTPVGRRVRFAPHDFVRLFEADPSDTSSVPADSPLSADSREDGSVSTPPSGERSSPQAPVSPYDDPKKLLQVRWSCASPHHFARVLAVRCGRRFVARRGVSVRQRADERWLCL